MHTRQRECLQLTDTGVLVSDGAKETHGEVKATPGASRALVLNCRLNLLAVVLNSDLLAADAGRVPSSSRVELPRVEGDL